jgi:hypothetical protein
LCLSTLLTIFELCRGGKFYWWRKQTDEYQEKTEQLKNDNPEKLATLGTQDEKKKEKHNTICAGHYYMQTNTNHVNKT